MFINECDFNKLTQEEIKLYKELLEKISSMHNTSVRYEYPDKIQYCLSLFPGNYLDHIMLKNEKELNKICDEFKALIENESINEGDILNFIKNKNAYHLIGSILKRNYNFGHHGTFIFPEFLPTIRQITL